MQPRYNIFVNMVVGSLENFAWENEINRYRYRCVEHELYEFFFCLVLKEHSIMFLVAQGIESDTINKKISKLWHMLCKLYILWNFLSNFSYPFLIDVLILFFAFFLQSQSH